MPSVPVVKSDHLFCKWCDDVARKSSRMDYKITVILSREGAVMIRRCFYVIDIKEE